MAQTFLPDSVAARQQLWEAYMDQALLCARQAIHTDDVPVGALVLSPDGATLATGHNQREAHSDPCAHAEIQAIRAAAQARGATAREGGWRLDGCTLVVTLEPCLMCAGALLAARIERLVFGAWDAKAGACGSVWDLVRDSQALHHVQVTAGVRQAQCAQLLSDFFASKRTSKQTG